MAYDSSFSYNISGSQLTLSAGTSIPNGAITGGSFTVAGGLTVNNLLQANGNISCAGEATTNVVTTSELNVQTNATVSGSLTCDSFTVTSGISGTVPDSFSHASLSTEYTSKVDAYWTFSGTRAYLSGWADTVWPPDGAWMEFERKAPSACIEMDPDMWSAYFDVEALEAGQPDEWVTRIQCNAPGKFTHQTVCILSGDQFPSATHVRIRVRRGTLAFTRLLFRDKNVGEAHPIG